MEPRPHQREGAQWALMTIREYGLAYLSWQERTGKTLTALLTVEASKAKTCLVVTKKKAIPGWIDTLNEWEHTTTFMVINYESVHKIKGDFDFIILDESHHAISSTGRPSKTWKAVKAFTHKKAILYLSATPYAEHLGLIYHQLKLSDWTPFPYRNFYDWFRVYGIPNMTRTPYGLVETYTKYHDEKILEILDPIFDFKTRKEVGIEHEPTANVVKVPMGSTNIELIKQLTRDSVIEFPDGTQIVCDTPMKERSVHYQIEGGTIKTDEGYIKCGFDKVNYIRNNYDLDNIAIMAHFIAERKELEKAFPQCKIYSADGHAEGVDLSGVAKLLIYSMSFKTSKYTQRLARQANHNRATEIIVDILVCDKPAIGMEVYKAVALKKENFDKNSYDRIR